MSNVLASAPHPQTGYKSFELGKFSFSRDEYFVTISWPAREAKLSHTMPVDSFLKALMRDVSWGFLLRLGQFRCRARDTESIRQRGAVCRPL